MSRTAVHIFGLLLLTGFAVGQNPPGPPIPPIHAAPGSGTSGRIPVFVNSTTVQDSVMLQGPSGTINVGSSLTLSTDGKVNGFAGSFVGLGGGIIGEDTTTNDPTASVVGVAGTTDNIEGAGVLGRAPATTGSEAVGVRGNSAGDNGRGVFGTASSLTGQTFGIFGRSDSSTGIGAAGRASDLGGNTVGVRGVVESPNGVAGQFLNNGGGDLLVGESQGTVVFRVDGTGTVHSGGADLAEHIDAAEQLTPGDVVEIDPSHEGRFRKVTSPRSTLVAGVISSAPAVVLGGRTATDMRPLLALAGRVPVKVTAEGGAINIGDLLTSSSRPGYAMRCSDRVSCAASVVGKALQPMNSDAGTILVLVTLQ